MCTFVKHLEPVFRSQIKKKYIEFPLNKLMGCIREIQEFIRSG